MLIRPRHCHRLGRCVSALMLCNTGSKYSLTGGPLPVACDDDHKLVFGTRLPHANQKIGGILKLEKKCKGKP